MTLLVWTARISYAGPDRLDITRKSAGPEGLPFAPSWRILGPALRARRAADALCQRADKAIQTPLDADGREDEWALVREAEAIEDEAWDAYVPAYIAEMRQSYRRERRAWEALLAREQVTLACYCPADEPLRCHRRILAGILVKLGAVDQGERIGG